MGWAVRLRCAVYTLKIRRCASPLVRASHDNLFTKARRRASSQEGVHLVSLDSLLPGSAKTERQHRLDICIAGRWMYEQGYNVACEGNVSVRLDAKPILTTPTCTNK